VAAGHEVVCVVTQPDRPRGRGQQAAAPPVKEAAERLGLAVYQPERVRRPEAVAHLRGLAVDAMVVVGYGQIIPQSVIDLAPLGIINVHASLLPKYRGAGPIQWAIVNGETRTGVTTMRIDAGLDTGDMLLKAETEIGPEETAIELGKRLAAMGAELLVETLAGLAAGTIVPEKQDPAQATYAPLLKKEDGRIDWSRPASAIHNQVRGLQPWPGAYGTFRGQRVHVWRTRGPGAGGRGPGGGGSGGSGVRNLGLEVMDQGSGIRDSGLGIREAGSILSLRPFVVGCGAGALELVEVQLEGRKRMAGSDFVNGQRVTEDEKFG
jgi:methionyl-tRNA formyltransferase